MLTSPMLYQHTFSLHFQRISNIRRDANELEDVLNKGCSGGYGSPQLFPFPDDFSPDAPRILFSAVSGFSTIAISQRAISLTVGYSEDYQANREKCVGYLRDRAKLLYAMLGTLNANIAYAGVGTHLRMMSENNDYDEVVSSVASMLIEECRKPSANEVMVRWSDSVEGRYFSNVTTSNVGLWADEIAPDGQFSMANRDGCAIEVIGDFNSRLAYNEGESAGVAVEDGLDMIVRGAQDAYAVAERFGGDRNG